MLQWIHILIYKQWQFKVSRHFISFHLYFLLFSVLFSFFFNIFVSIWISLLRFPSHRIFVFVLFLKWVNIIYILDSFWFFAFLLSFYNVFYYKFICFSWFMCVCVLNCLCIFWKYCHFWDTIYLSFIIQQWFLFITLDWQLIIFSISTFRWYNTHLKFDDVFHIFEPFLSNN